VGPDREPVLTTALAYFWGEDSFGLEQAARGLASDLEKSSGQAPDVWRTGTGDEEAAGGAAAARTKTIERIEQRIATSTLFGSGTVVVVRQPGALLAEAGARQRVLALLPQVAPGNALCFLDLIPSGNKAPAANGLLRDAVAEAGGAVNEFAVPTRDRMEGWIGRRASEMGITLGPGAAKAVAEKVGAFVREADVDRRRQSELANGELEKLALYRPSAPVTPQDVDALVGEAIPGSTWAFLDALAARRGGEAAMLLERLLAGGAPIPLLIAQIHRRLRDLIMVRDHLDAGTRPPDLVRALKLQPYRAQKLAEQAAGWDAESLGKALGGLLEIDLLSKGIAADGSPRSLSEDRSRLALMGWIGERVSGRGGSATRPRSG
jgi:DNA polymerase III delta subunit